jgi:amino acid transporter
MIWCELGAALPGSGGTYHYLREVFRPFRFGRVLPFVFIWQFIFSGPLEISTGCIGFVRYLHELWPQSWGALAVVGGDREDVLTIQGKVMATALTGWRSFFLYRGSDPSVS